MGTKPARDAENRKTDDKPVGRSRRSRLRTNGLSRLFAQMYRAVVGRLVTTVATVALRPGIADGVKVRNRDFLPAGTLSRQVATMVKPFQNIDYVAGTIIASRDTGALTPTDTRAAQITGFII
jgi:hypothetical protein